MATFTLKVQVALCVGEHTVDKACLLTYHPYPTSPEGALNETGQRRAAFVTTRLRTPPTPRKHPHDKPDRLQTKPAQPRVALRPDAFSYSWPQKRGKPSSFWPLCFGTLILGVYGAFGLYYRFAATDSASGEFTAKASRSETERSSCRHGCRCVEPGDELNAPRRLAEFVDQAFPAVSTARTLSPLRAWAMIISRQFGVKSSTRPFIMMIDAEQKT